MVIKMGLLSVYELCDELLKSKVFNCTKCGQLLISPIITVGERGNVCNSCYQKHFTHSDHTSNHTLDRLLEGLDFSCEYEYCTNRISLKDYPAHVEYCRYRLIECEEGKCSWKGMRNAYIDHYSKEHQIRVVKGDKYDVVGIKENKLKTDIWQTSCGSFVSHVLLTSKWYSLMVCDIGHTPKYSDLELIVKCTDGYNSCTAKCSITDSNQILVGYTDGFTTKVNREALKIIFQQEPTISLELHVANVLTFEELTKLKCSNCSDFLTPPTFTCTSGAGDICSRCFLGGPICECCRSWYIENKALNALLSRVRYPCRFRDKGCAIKFFSATDHETTCSHKMWRCTKCSSFESSEYTNLIQHLQTEHIIPVIRKDSKPVFTFTRCTEEEKKYCLRAFGRIFIIVHKCDDVHKDHTCKWAVEHIGPKDNRFVFEVEFFSNECPNKSIILSNECHYNGEAPNWYKIKRSAFDNYRHKNEQYTYSVIVKPYNPNFFMASIDYQHNVKILKTN